MRRRKAAVLLAWVVLGAAIAGCALDGGRNLLKTREVSILIGPSETAKVRGIDVRAVDGKIHVCGSVTKPHGRGAPDTGHIDIKGVGPSGEEVCFTTTRILYRNVGGPARIYWTGRFTANLPVLPRGSVLHIGYHDAEDDAASH